MKSQICIPAWIAAVCLAVGVLLSGVSLSFDANGADRVPTERITRFLVMGCDASEHLTDSILLLSLNENLHRVRILQIPRDTYAEYTEKDYKKLNGAMNVLGAGGVKQFLSQAIGVPIDYYVVLQLRFFGELVDAVGGVEMEIPNDMEYDDPSQNLRIRLKSGMTRLDGAAAQQLVRYRSGYANADLGRLDTQKLFLRAFAKQCQTLSGMQLLHLLSFALTGVRTDMDLPSAIRVVRILQSCDAETMQMATLSGQAVQGTSGAWYYVVNRQGGQAMVNSYLMPSVPLTLSQFDAGGVFDRESNVRFHRIYLAQPETLPLRETN